jgi:glycosyltransferase involved in cell wall biosynthesis
VTPIDISLVVPAWNEAALLAATLREVDAARFAYLAGRERIEVIVADNASTDATLDIARAAGAKVAPVGKRSIAAARNGGAAVATGEIVAFVDADVRIHPQTFNFVRTAMARGDYVGGAVGLTMERWSTGIALVWYAVMPALWLAGYDGGVMFCRRADFRRLGGYKEDLLAAEDVEFMSRLRRLGRSRRPKQRFATRFSAKRLGIDPALAINSCRKFDQYGDWHLLPVFFRTGLWALLRRSKFEATVKSYWYQGRG